MPDQSTDEDVRAAYMAAQARLDAVEAERDRIIKAATAHLDAEWTAAQEAFEDLRETIPEYRGRCEICATPLFDGDLAHDDWESEVMFCADHAPMVSDCLKFWQREAAALRARGQPEIDEMGEPIADTISVLEAQIAAEGDKRAVVPL